MRRMTLWCFAAILAAAPALAADEKLGPGWTEAGKIPEKYERLLACAERGSAICQYWMGRLWVGDDLVSSGPLVLSGLLNPPEARRWYHAAALQGHREAMFDYGGLFCYSAYLMELATPNRIVEGIAWILASNLFENMGKKIFEYRLCSDFTNAIENKLLDKKDTMHAARLRAKRIEKEVSKSNGFHFRIIDPCEPFYWIENDDPFKVLFKSCLDFRLSNFVDYLSE